MHSLTVLWVVSVLSMPIAPGKAAVVQKQLNLSSQANGDQVFNFRQNGNCCKINSKKCPLDQRLFCLAALNLIFFADCGKSDSLMNRIVGGEEVSIHEYPWQVALASEEGKLPYCGGTLISSKHVMTAAHCFDR